MQSNVDVLEEQLRALTQTRDDAPPEDKEIWDKQIRRIEGDLQREREKATGSLG